MWQNTGFFPPLSFWKVMLQIPDLQKTKAAFSGDVSVFWAFDPSRYFFHSYLHTCVNKDNKDVQMHHHASLPEAVQPALFFQNISQSQATRSRLGTAAAHGSSGDIATSQMVNGHKRTITTIGGIYSQTAATKIRFSSFPWHWMSHIVPFFKIFISIQDSSRTASRSQLI